MKIPLPRLSFSCAWSRLKEDDQQLKQQQQQQQQQTKQKTITTKTKQTKQQQQQQQQKRAVDFIQSRTFKAGKGLKVFSFPG